MRTFDTPLKFGLCALVKGRGISGERKTSLRWVVCAQKKLSYCVHAWRSVLQKEVHAHTLNIILYNHKNYYSYVACNKGFFMLYVLLVLCGCVCCSTAKATHTHHATTCDNVHFAIT